MKFLCFLSLFLIFENTFSQVGIGTVSPEASATLHLEDANKGLLLNRVALVDVTNGVSPVNTPVTGLLVYNTNAAIIGGQGVGFYFWDGAQWQKLVTTHNNTDWALTGNSGTNPSSNFIGTTDNQDFVVRTNNTEKLRVEAGGDVGIGTNNPSHTLEVQGDVLFQGDFVNQEMIGVSSGTVQNIPYTNGISTPLTDTVTSITIVDGSGVDNSAVFISAFARVNGGNLIGNNSSLGGYFIALQRDTTATFTAPVILTYTSGICYIETPGSGSTSSSLGFGGGGSISYIENNLAPGTYYYRLILFTNGVGIIGGTYDVYQRTLNVIQMKR